MLEIEVKHDINKNYLIVHGQQEGDYMVQMLDGNKIKGFLNMEVRKIDNQSEYYYDITGKENLSQKTTRGKWKYEELVKLVAEILEVVGKAREYLLSEEYFLLQPEYIYREISSGEVFLCYAWSESKNINEQFTQLFTYFLNVVDYEDERAVQLVYQLYDVSREEQCTLQRLWSVFETVDSPVSRIDDESFHEEIKQTLAAEDRKSKRFKDKLWMEKKEERGALAGEEKKKRGRVRKLKPDRNGNCFLGKFQKLLEKLSGETKESDCIAKKLGNTTKETGNTAKEICMKAKGNPITVKQEKKQGISFYKENIAKMSFPVEDRTQFTRQEQTVCCLSGEKEKSAKQEYHCHLLPEDKSQCTISMGEFPFYIGRFQKDTNGLKEILSISRMHCKIEQTEGKYYVSDLHSTNGTYVNRIKLAEGNKTELKNGDELAIADIKYRFSL